MPSGASVRVPAMWPKQTTSSVRPVKRILQGEIDAKGRGDAQGLRQARRCLAALQLADEADSHPSRQRDVLQTQVPRFASTPQGGTKVGGSVDELYHLY